MISIKYATLITGGSKKNRKINLKKISERKQEYSYTL